MGLGLQRKMLWSGGPRLVPSLLLLLLLLPEALSAAAGQASAKNKRPKEPGENKIKPANKRGKPTLAPGKDRDSVATVSKTSSIMMQVMEKGRFQKPAATLSLAAGQSLELRCKGNKIQWHYPEYLDTFKDSRLSMKQHDRYGQLILVNATAADTGEYSCWQQVCSGYVCRKDEAKTGTTYIFFTEKGELFVPSPSYFGVVYLNPDRESVVPCRVTVPSAKVTLHKEFPAKDSQSNGSIIYDIKKEKGELFVPSPNYFGVVYLNPDREAVVPCRVTVPSAKVTLHREFPAKEIQSNGSIIYDIKRGFVYLHPQLDQQGVVYCRAEAHGAPQISIKYQLLYVEVPSGPPSTTIVASSNRVNGGDDITVLCTVLGEPDVEVEFRWIYPGLKDERPVTIQDTWRLVSRGLGCTTRLSQSVLALQDFETIDAGYYMCTAQNLRGQTTVATTVELS